MEIILMTSISHKPRARDLGIPFTGTTGPNNAITDVEGVTVGYSTIIEGEGKLETGKGPARTGVTAILPRGKTFNPVFSGWYSLNGNGEMTGTTWVEESGFLEGPIAITNTHSVGVVRDSVVSWLIDNDLTGPHFKDLYWLLPVVAETWDGILNDINGMHVKKEHVYAALDNAAGGKIAEGNVGGGTGMNLFHFKGGTGTSSRKLSDEEGGYTVGVLVQGNFGRRQDLMIAGVPVGEEITELMQDTSWTREESGSIIVVVATDAPLLPHQLKRLARRVPVGIGRVGGFGANGSGDIFIAFSTANPDAFSREETTQMEMVSNNKMDPLIQAAALATEEAIINAMIAAETMKGRDDNISYALPHDRLVEVMKKYNRHSE
ncbi:P1 family peptidase [Pseudochrobactrum saccharolyticum]|nr:P1 family peptidase [Pseudochrobactrum saccharolyticum]